MLGAREKVETRRDAILRAARKVFARKGYHDASIADIIQEADIARGTFYLYFPNKRSIFDSLLLEFIEELNNRIQALDLSPGKPSAIEQLRTNLRGALSLIQEEPELTQILLDYAPGLDRQAMKTVRRFFDSVVDLIERSVVDGISLGLVRPCDTRLMSLCIVGTVKQVAEELASRRRNVDLEAMIAEILNFGLYGLLTVTPDVMAAPPEEMPVPRQ